MANADRKIMGEHPPEANRASHPTDNMGFLDHLEELRWRILKGMIGMVLGIIVAVWFNEFFINKVMLGPTSSSFFIYDWLGIDAIDLTLQSRKLPSQFFTYWGTLLVVGGILGAPVFFYQFYMFVEPAMMQTGKARTKFTVAGISFLFMLGVLFGYFVLTPFAVQFFSQFQISTVIINEFDINEYFSTLTLWVLACGFIFQMPMVSYFLSKVGILTPQFMRTYRRHALVFCFVVGAFLTPPDPLSQIIMAVPIFGLYEFSIFVSRLAERQRNKEIWGDKDGSELTKKS